MNAGAMGVETFDQVLKVTFLDEDGEIRVRVKDEIESFYRNVPELRRNYALEATFEGAASNLEAIQGRLDESRHHRNTTQPKAASAGCTFKNPEVCGAGQLIDEMGLKETGVGKAEVSLEHGNFIVNRGKASAADVLALIEQIRTRARERGEWSWKPRCKFSGKMKWCFRRLRNQIPGHDLRHVLKIASGLLLASVMAGAKPNIVVLYSDDAGYADFGFQPELRRGYEKPDPEY